MLDSQNRSHAVMSQRYETSESFDDFPTPPWATRALMEHVLHAESLKGMSCIEPACGRGYMSCVLEEYFGSVFSSDIADYGFGAQVDFILSGSLPETDWLITNPPFRLAEEFIIKGLKFAKRGVAVLVRTVFLESVGRYNRLFSSFPPSFFAQFVERVPIIKGRIDQKASSATGYAWIVWDKRADEQTKVIWIPPCRKKLEKLSDYNNSSSSTPQKKNSNELLGDQASGQSKLRTP